MPDLSIIIVSYRGWERLIKCLDSLRFSGDRTFSHEVIVVDNNSADGRIYEIERDFPDFRFIHNGLNGGFGYGCNSGAEHASGEYLLFLNPDTVVSANSLKQLLALARRSPSVTLLTCRQQNEKGKESRVTGRFPEFRNLTGLLRAFSQKPGLPDPCGDLYFTDWVSGSVMLMKKTVFESIGGFDEDYWMYYEDVDICRRIKDSGGMVAMAMQISIEHNHGGSSRINLKTASLTKTEVHISRHVYIRKHKRGSERMFIQTFLVLNNIFSGILTALSGLIFFFIPKLFSRTLIFGRLIKYYALSVRGHTWTSPRSVNYLRQRNAYA